MKVPRPLRPLLDGGAGVAFAVLLPRAMSLAIQWLLALAAGPAALATFVSLTARGSVVVSLVAAGLSPTLAHRTRALATPGGRALIGGALALLAMLACAVTLTYEAAFGLGGMEGVVAAVFSACALFASVAPAVWPVWQLDGSYLRAVAMLLALSPGASAAAALWGRPAVACMATGLAGASSALRLLRPRRLRRTGGYALALLRRSVPLSISNFATAIVYPIALSAGAAALGDHRVGQQALYWSFVAALSVASQSFATRAIAVAQRGAGGAPEGGARPEATRRVAALRAWARPAAALVVVAVGLYAVFSMEIPGLPRAGFAREAMVPSMLVSGVAPVLTDPLCFYFSGPGSRRPLAIGSAACGACVAGALLLAPSVVIGRLGVIGPSALVGVLRLLFVLDGSVRRVAWAAALALLGGYAATMLL